LTLELIKGQRKEKERKLDI